MSRVEEALRRARLGSPIPESVHLSPRALDRFPMDEGTGPGVEPPHPYDEPRKQALRTEESPLEKLPELPRDPRLVTCVDAPRGSVEQHRRLAAALLQRQLTGTLRTVMVTSAVPREGKTLTTVNLALTLSEAYKRRVLLIDADLRRPSVHELLAFRDGNGLAEALRGAMSRPALTRVSSTLSVLPGGRPTSNPMAGLTSDRMKAFLEEAAAAFDFVLIDTPPVGLLPDARVLASGVDGVLLVIAAGATPFAVVRDAVEEILPERLIGLILNKVKGNVGHHGYYYRYYSDPQGRPQS
jgi:protein-tyrosine kinase